MPSTRTIPVASTRLGRYQVRMRTKTSWATMFRATRSLRRPRWLRRWSRSRAQMARSSSRGAGTIFRTAAPQGAANGSSHSVITQRRRLRAIPLRYPESVSHSSRNARLHHQHYVSDRRLVRLRVLTSCLSADSRGLRLLGELRRTCRHPPRRHQLQRWNRERTDTERTSSSVCEFGG